MGSTTRITNKKKGASPKQGGQETSAISKIMLWSITLFFVAVWCLLSFYESSLLQRIEAQSLFLFDDTFFDATMNVPAGLLAYLGSFLMQFFYYPALGATIFVLLLLLLFLLVKKVFDISGRYSMFALLPSVLILASNTQAGYWIFYIKHPGWYYVALLGVMASLLAMWAFRKISWRMWLPFVVAWSVLLFPVLGIYACASSVCMGVMGLSCAVRSSNRKRLWMGGIIPLIAAVVLVALVPYIWYHFYSTVSLEFIYGAGLPIFSWDFGRELNQSILPYWVPFVLLFVAMLCFSATVGKMKEAPSGFRRLLVSLVSLLLYFLYLCFVRYYWYDNQNFRIENLQDSALWNLNWREAADLARNVDVPSRQIVMNKNVALLNLGRAGDEMFTYPDGSAEIDAPMNVHLTQTGGMMMYFLYGKFNFCYRWCVENAVESGWKPEYLKHAVRCMLAQGEYTLAKRYINILKHTMFHKGWAREYEKYIDNPELLAAADEFKIPMQMYHYHDVLAADESHIEVYLMKELSQVVYKDSPAIYDEASLMASLIRKDKRLFWNSLVAYLSGRKINKLPRHYQEAVLMFQNLDRSIDASQLPIDNAVRVRFNSFMKKTTRYKGWSEADMAPYFKEDFGDTYWYFYFFVRGIKSN